VTLSRKLVNIQPYLNSVVEYSATLTQSG